MEKPFPTALVIASLASDASAAVLENVLAHPFLATAVIAGIAIAAHATGKLTRHVLLFMIEGLQAFGAAAEKSWPDFRRMAGEYGRLFKQTLRIVKD